MKLALNEIKAPHKKDRDTLNLKDLIESMKEVGQIEPIIINQRNEIISGRRRFYAAKELKLAKLDVIYFEKSAIDQELASIDSNLMILPLGDVDHDQALARKKKLYEQKYPETKKYAPGNSDKKSFGKDISQALGITSRSVELAVARAEKSSPKVVSARREGKISPTVVNELIRLPSTYQDKLLGAIEGKTVSQVRGMVDLALQKDADYVVHNINKNAAHSIPDLSQNFNRMMKVLHTINKSKVPPTEAKPLIEQANQIIELLEKFIEKNTPIHKPILRKMAHAS